MIQLWSKGIESWVMWMVGFYIFLVAPLNCFWARRKQSVFYTVLVLILPPSCGFFYVVVVRSSLERLFPLRVNPQNGAFCC